MALPITAALYSRRIVADAAAVIDRLGSDPAVVLGHSLGGITAYQLAAHHPELVRALIIEDVGAVMRQPEVSHRVLNVRGWSRFAPARETLAEAIRAQGVPDVTYFLHSAVAVSRVGGCFSTSTRWWPSGSMALATGGRLAGFDLPGPALIQSVGGDAVQTAAPGSSAATVLARGVPLRSREAATS